MTEFLKVSLKIGIFQNNRKGQHNKQFVVSKSRGSPRAEMLALFRASRQPRNGPGTPINPKLLFLTFDKIREIKDRVLVGDDGLDIGGQQLYVFVLDQ